MKRDFEEYFPLPFHIEEDEMGQLRTLCPASGTAFMDFGIVEGPLDFDGYDVQEYLVKCANLMPEAARLLNEALRIIEKACIACANIDAYHCGLCGREETTREIKALLAELEGGAETE